MSQTVLLHDKKTDASLRVELEPETFVVSCGTDGSVEQMTYGQWEALRCQQACDRAKKELAERDLSEAARASIEGYLDMFTEDMKVKYLEGACSWGQIYDTLLSDFCKLAQ